MIGQAGNKILINYFTSSRPLNCDVCFITQSVYLVPVKLRRNVSHWALFVGSLDDSIIRKTWWRQVLDDVPWRVFNYYYKKICMNASKPHDCLVIDSGEAINCLIPSRRRLRYVLDRVLWIPQEEDDVDELLSFRGPIENCCIC